MSDKVRERSREGRSAGREWLFRLAAGIGAPVLLLAAVESADRLLLDPVEYPLPGVDEAARFLYFAMPERFHPLFQPDEAAAEPSFRTSPQLHEGVGFWVQDQAFPAQRSPEAVRVAFVGGSSVQGWPFRDAEAVFPHFVGQSLGERFPERRIDVINAGVGSYNSFQLIDVVDQLEAFRPDVLVVYAGHNDQGYYFFYKAFLDGLGGGRSLRGQLNRLQVYQRLRLARDRRWGRTTDGRLLGEQVDPLGDKEPPKDFRPKLENVFTLESEGKQAYSEEEYAEFVRLTEHYLPQTFRTNLEALVAKARAGGMEVILARPASNLRDYAPALNLHRDPPSSRDRKRFDALLEEARTLMTKGGAAPRRMEGILENGIHVTVGNEPGVVVEPGARSLGDPRAVRACEAALERLAEAKAISASWAELWFLEATCLLHTDAKAARAAFVRARDLSPAQAPRQRAPTALQSVVDEVAEELGVPLVDIPAAFAAASAEGIPGADLFVDNLHFNSYGHRVAAEAISRVVAQTDALQHIPERPPDPPAAEVERILAEKKQHMVWGMNLPVTGSGEGLEGEGDYGRKREAP